jgi:hypothetical protein
MASEILQYLMQLTSQYRGKRTCVDVLCRRKGNISETIASINLRILRSVAQNVVKRMNACIQENGGHFQHLL